MPVLFKSKLSSSAVNAIFLDKTIDDATVGLFSLRHISTADVEDVQAFLNTLRADINFNDGELADHEIRITNNTRSIATYPSLAAGGVIPLSADVTDQTFKVKTVSGAAQLSSTPFGAAEPVDGAMIIIIGQSDSDYSTIVFNDVDYGCLLNGNINLKRGISLSLTYDKPLKRYIELSRNS